MRALPDRRLPLSTILIALIAATLAFLAVIQVRSQAEVARSLETQDNTALAFLIDDLHTANDQLAAQEAGLAARGEAMRQSNGSGVPTLSDESQRLKIVAGLVPVKGPGVTIVVDAPLNALDIQDAVNNLRAGGAEAISVDGIRVIAGSVITQSGEKVSIDGTGVGRPWSLAAIGGPTQLDPQVEAMTSSLRADPRVKSAASQAQASLVIQAVVRQRPFVYAGS